MARKGIYPESVTPGIPKNTTPPKGWSKVRFGDVLKIVKRSADLEGEEEYQLVVAKRNRGGIVERQKLKGRKILTKTQFFIRKGDFLISRRQIIHGACGIVPEHLDGAVVSNEYSTLLAKPKLSMNFMKHYCHSIHFQQTCFQSSVGVDVEKMIFKIDQWLKYKFNIPPLSEQKKIAEILGTWDKAIEMTEKLIDAKTRRKKGLMQQLLTGKTRSVELIGQKWIERLVGELGAIYSGGTPSTDNPKYWNGDIFWCTPTDITGILTKYINKTIKKITEKGLEKSSAKLLPPKSVIICTRASIGECAINLVPITTNQGFKSLVLNKRFVPEFVYYWMVFNKQMLLKFACGSTFLEISKRDLSKIKISTPSMKEQKNIADVLSACDREIELLNKKLEALKQQKKGLMQKLLTGALRVPVSNPLLK